MLPNQKIKRNLFGKKSETLQNYDFQGSPGTVKILFIK